MEITTYPEMNNKIKDFLRISDNPLQLYAAQRIEELEAELDEYHKYDTFLAVHGLFDNTEPPQKLYEANTIPGFAGVCEWDVTGVRFNDGKVQEYIVKNSVTMNGTFHGDEIGKTVFFTREEAEKALKEAQG